VGARDTLIKLLAEATGLARSGQDAGAALKSGLAGLKMDLGGDKALEAQITKLETSSKDPHVLGVLATTRSELGFKPVRRLGAEPSIPTPAKSAQNEMRGHFRFMDETTGQKSAERVMSVVSVKPLDSRAPKGADGTLGVAELGGKFQGKHIPVLIGPSGDMKPFFKRLPAEGRGRPTNTLPMFDSSDEAASAAMGDQYRRGPTKTYDAIDALKNSHASEQFTPESDPEEMGQGAPGVVGAEAFQGEPVKAEVSSPFPPTRGGGKGGMVDRGRGLPKTSGPEISELVGQILQFARTKR
jgi:hypothetical protein